MRIKIKVDSLIAKWAAKKLKVNRVAITIGNTICLYHCSREAFLANEPWVCHEVKHVMQFKQFGLVTFTIMYLWESLRKGYHNNKWEIEARDAEHDLELLNGIEFV